MRGQSILAAIRRRHILALVLLAGVVLFGRNFQGISLISQEQYQNGIDQAVSNYDQRDTVVLSQERPEHLYPGLLAQPAGTYRIDYLVRVPTVPSVSQLAEASERPAPPVTITIRAYHTDGTEASLFQATVPVGDDYLPQSTTVKQDGTLLSLGVSASNLPDGGSMQVQGFKTTLSSTSASGGFANVVGTEAHTAALLPKGDLSQATEATWLWRSNQTIGQVFQATTDNLSSVSLKLKLRGSGGGGTYHLELHPVVMDGGSYTVQPQALAQLAFRPDEGWKYGDQGGGEHTWRLPLSAFLKPGSYYFVGISDRDADLDVFNNLALYGFRQAGALPALGLRPDGQYAIPGELYLETWSQSALAEEGAKLLPESIVHREGNIATFSYTQRQGPASFLDLDRDTMLAQAGQGTAAYDEARHGIAGPSRNGFSLMYRIPTLYPARKVFVSADEFGDGQDVVLSVSTDGRSWTDIPRRPAVSPGKGDAFLGSVEGGGATALWVRVGYDPTHLDSRKESVFGVTGLSVQADLNPSL